MNSSIFINPNFVRINGLTDPDTIDLTVSPYWTQLSIPEVLCVPAEKPEIEQLHELSIGVEICRTKVIVTPVSTVPVTNWEGRIATGRKLIIEGQLCQTVTYVGAVDDQSLHTAHFVVPFSACIVLPGTVEGKDPLSLDFQINSCVEDVYVKEFCGRQIFKNVTLLLQAIAIPHENNIMSEEFSGEEMTCHTGVCLSADSLAVADNYSRLPMTIYGVCSSEEIEAFLKPGDQLWRQLFIPEILCIPQLKPDLEQIVSVHLMVEILAQRVICSPAMAVGSGSYTHLPVKNEEGLYSTGKKLVIAGVLRQKLVYVAANPAQSVHAAHFDVPFSTFIVLPPDALLTTHYRLETCVEDVYVSYLTPREIFKNVTLMIKATPLVCS